MDASQWIKEHPWPHGVAIEDSKAAKSSRHHLRRCLRFAAGFCGRSGADVLDDDDEATLAGDLERDVGRFRWTPELKDGFCDELQKLVALDYLMLNTDRGLSVLRTLLASHTR
jgi:phosphatidylinositol 4-kinase type 2